MAKMGRKVVPIDWEQLDKLCQFPHRQEDIAFLMGCSLDKLAIAIREKYDETFSEFHEKRISKLRVSVLQKQFECAMRGNITMLIWLGKNLLKQRDKFPEEETQKQPDPETNAERIKKLKAMINDLPD